jgi:hypothetical protein
MSIGPIGPMSQAETERIATAARAARTGRENWESRFMYHTVRGGRGGASTQRVESAKRSPRQEAGGRVPSPTCGGTIPRKTMGTDPFLEHRHRRPEGPRNDEAIAAACEDADLVVCAWGTHGAHRGRGDTVMDLLAGRGLPVHFLRQTQGGHPGHPLYLPASLQPQRWR